MLSCNLFFLTLPRNTKWWIRDNIIKLVASKFIIGKGVTKLHIVWVTATNQHISLGNTKGKWIEFLSENINICIGIKGLKPFFHTGQHLACTHCHIINSLGNAFIPKGIIIPGHQQITHEIDNISTGEMGSSFLIVGL